MRLSNKHANPQLIEYKDFSGGLNTSNASEMIRQNELAKAVNVQIDQSTGLLKTVSGMDTIYKDPDKTFDVLIYDVIGDTFLMITTDGTVYALSREVADGVIIAPSQTVVIEEKGQLTGNGRVASAVWEDGVIIASGGKLQYYHGGTLETITESPDTCKGAFVKDGRVWTFWGDELHASGVGDEHQWENDPNRDNSSQWLQIGYKDGGSIVGLCALSSDTLVFKDNHHAYRVSGSYPDWVVKEVGRSIDCKALDCCLSVGNSVVTLGDARMQAVSVTNEYGDMKAAELSIKVAADIRALGEAKLRYVSPLNQVWIFNTATDTFLFYDIGCQGFFHRRYRGRARDVATIQDDIYILKEHGLYKNTDRHMTEDGEPIRWAFQAKTMVSNNHYLIKRVSANITPYFENYAEEWFKVGDVVLWGGLPWTSRGIWHNFAQIYHCKLPLKGTRARGLYQNSDEVYDDEDYIYGNETYIRSINCYGSGTRCVNRRPSIPVRARGGGGITLFNAITFEIAEV